MPVLVKSEQTSIRPSSAPLLVLPLGLLGVAAAIWWSSQLELGLLFVLALVNMIVALVGVVASFSRGLRPATLIFNVFFFAWLGIAPVYQLAVGQFVWGDRPANHAPANIAQALLLTLLALICFGIGTFAASRRPSAREPAVVRQSLVPWLALAAVATSVFAVQRAGGIATMFASRQDRFDAISREAGDLEGGPIGALTRVAPVSLSVALALATVFSIRRSGGWRRARILDRFALMTSIVLIALVANPFSNSRFIAAAAIGSLLLALIPIRGRLVGAVVALVSIITVIVVYPAANAFRSDTIGSARSGVAAFATADFDGFQQIVNSVEMAESSGHTLGKYLSSSVAFFIPRAIWPDKAIPASIDVATDAGYWFTNLSLPIHAELYLEFGVAGVAVGLFSLGWLAGRVDSAWVRNDGSGWQMAAPLLAFAMLGIVRGPLGSLLPIYGTAFIVMALILTNSRRHRHHNLAAASSREETVR